MLINNKVPEMLEIFIIDPPPGRLASIILFAASWLTRNVPFRLVCIISSKTDSFRKKEKMGQSLLTNCYITSSLSLNHEINSCTHTSKFVVRHALVRLPALFTTISGPGEMHPLTFL